jgi:hypothetical protein
MAGPPPGLSRRRFLTLAGAGAGAIALGACGGGDDGEDADGTSTTTAAASKLQFVQFSGGPLHPAGSPLRVPFGVADSEGLLTVEKSPGEIEVTILSPDGAEVGEPITVARRGKGLPRSYYALETTLDEAGVYTMRGVPGDGPAAEMAFQVHPPAEVTLIKPGDALPSIDTPTVDDARGVNPMCTHDPVCPLHDLTVTQALTEDRPLALLVATPAFCKVAICGPVLDVFLEKVDAHPDVRFLHAEPFADPFNDPQLTKLTPALMELRLISEPVLVLVGSDGTVVQRIDSIYDGDELDERLAGLS